MVPRAARQGYISSRRRGCQSNSQIFGQISIGIKVGIHNLLNLLMEVNLTLLIRAGNAHSEGFSMAHFCYRGGEGFPLGR